MQDFNLEFSFLIIKIESSYEKKRKINSVVEKFFTTHNFSAQIQKINLDAVQTEQNFVLLLMLKTYQNSFKLTSGTCLKHSTLLMKFVRFSFCHCFRLKNYVGVFLRQLKLATLYPNQLGAYEMICSLCTCRQNSLKKNYVYPSIPRDWTNFSSPGRKNE